ncbi:MAG TPA: MFS transporter [Vicinamibacterales bacterium]|nr:MFS transporter [Vicinamibacterales bacterium]
MKRSPIWIILFTILIDTLGIGILGPILPQLLGNPNSPHYLLAGKMDVRQGYVLFGFLVAVYPVMQFFATPVLGQLSDRHGRKPVLALSLAGTALGYALFATGIVIKNIPLLFFARAMDGITGGNLSVAQASIADVTKPEDRTKNFGLIGAAFGVGFIVGPFLGGVLADPSVLSWFTAATPFWFAALLAAANTTQVLVQYQETNRHIRQFPMQFFKGIKNIARAYAMPELRTIFLTSFFFNMGFGFFISFFGLFLIYRFNFNEANIGNFFAWVGVCAIVTQIVTTPRVAARFAEAPVLKVTLLGVAAVMFLYLAAPTPLWLFLIAPVSSTFNGLSLANMGGLLSRSVAPQVQGEILGIGSSIQALAQSLPPLMGGFFAASFAPQAPVFAAGLTMLVAWGIFAVLFRVPRAAAAVAAG